MTPWAAIAEAILENVGNIGAGISNLYGAKGIMSEEDEARLQELKARQDLGALGLTDEEMAILDQRVFGGLRGAEREGRARRFEGVQDTGAAEAFRARQGEAQRMAQARAPGQQAIAQAQEAERRAEEKEIVELGRIRQAEETAKRQAWVDIIVGAAGAGEDYYDALQSKKAGEEEIGGLESVMSEDVDMGEAFKYLESYA